MEPKQHKHNNKKQKKTKRLTTKYIEIETVKLATQ